MRRRTKFHSKPRNGKAIKKELAAIELIRLAQRGKKMPTISQRALFAIIEIFRARYRATVILDESGRVAIDGELPSVPVLARIATAYNSARENDGVAIDANFRNAPNSVTFARVTPDDIADSIRWNEKTPERVAIATVRFPKPGTF